MTKLQLIEVHSPIGAIRAAFGPRGLCAMGFAERWDVAVRGLRRRFGRLAQEEADDPRGIAARLEAYWRGTLDAFDDLQVDPGGTPFQQRVWSALRMIPAGRTISYGALARAVGVPSGARPVGMANARNPVAIVIPCHRVVGSDGELTGYAGGLERKRWLLTHEGARRGAEVATPTAAD